MWTTNHTIWSPKRDTIQKVQRIAWQSIGKTVVNFRNKENIIRSAILTAAEFRFPFTELVLQYFVQQYFNCRGLNLSAFNDNQPAKDWCHNFMLRHPELARRRSENVERCRADLSPEVIQDYFNRLKTTVSCVPPPNVIHCNQTNITDDPSSVKIFVRKGTNFATRTMNFFKTSTFVIFAIAADGTLRP